MSLKSLREKYLSGSMSKLDYVGEVQGILGALEDIGEFMKNTDLKSIKIRSGGVICSFNSVPVKTFFESQDKTSPAVQALCFDYVEGDYSRKLIEAAAKAKVFFDVGANAGWYSIICSKLNPEAGIYSFEPINSTYMKLIRNIALNSCINIFPNNFGLSDFDGVKEMYFDESESGAGSLRDIRGNANRRETALFMRLDDFVERYRVVPDVMKIDVEGSELFILKGGEKTLRENSPVIFIEILRKWCRVFGHSAGDVVALLHDCGYTGHVIRGRELEVIDSITEEIQDTNFVFTKGETLLTV